MTHTSYKAMRWPVFLAGLVTTVSIGVMGFSATAQAQEEPPQDDQSRQGPAQDQIGDEQAGDEQAGDDRTGDTASLPSLKLPGSDETPRDLQAIINSLPKGAIDGLIGAEIEIEVVGQQIFLQGPEEAVAVLELLILGLDEGDVKAVLEMVRVNKRDANDLASNLESILRELLREPNQDPEDDVTIKALSPSLLLVSALPQYMDFIIEVIQQADEEVDEIAEFERMVFPIKYRKAADVAEKLQEIITKIQARRGDTKEIQIIPNSANNTIMVIAPITERGKIQDLLDTIDVEPVAGFGEVKLVLFPLRHSKATELADVIESLLSSPQEADAAEETIMRLLISKALASGEIVDLPPIDLQKNIRITPDEGTNSLIVSTAEENIEPMKELIGLLDGVPSAEELEVSLFPLRFADAQSVRDVIGELFTQGKELPPDPDGSGDQAVPEGLYGPGLVYEIGLFADVRTNTLIFAGRATQLTLVQTLVTELDKPATALKFPLRIVPLVHTDATRTGQIITTLFDQRFEAISATNPGAAALERERVFLSVDIRSNSFIVSASEENYAEIVTIAEQLDTIPAKLFDQLRIIPCKRLSAAAVKTQIDELWQRKASLRQEEELLEDLPIVVADGRSNALIVASSVEDYEEIKTLVEALEAQPLIDDTKLFKLEFADAKVLAGIMDELFQGLAGQSDTFTEPTIIADSRSNTLLIAAMRDTMERVDDVVKRLDVKPGETSAQLRVYPLVHASSVKLAQRMQELFDSRAEGQNIEGTPIVILSEEGSNSLVCSASRGDQDVIVELLDLLDRPSSLARQFQIFPMKTARATQVAEKLTTIFESQSDATGGRADAIAVEAYERTNALIVWASPSQMLNIEEMIARLDTATPSVEMMVRIIQLKQALADEFADLLTSSFIGEDAGSDDERAVIISWVEELPNGKKITRKLLRQDITVQADPRTNSLMVTAPTESMEMLEAMIRDFDTIRPVNSEIRLFPLINADAASMVDLLDELFNPDAGDGETVTQLNVGGEFPDLDAARVGQDLRFSADERTNTIIAAGAKIDLQMAEEMIRYLDAQEAEERVTQVYASKFLPAADLASAVDGFFQQEDDVFSVSQDATSTLRQMERKVSVEAVGNEDGGSSKLIIGTSRQNFHQTMDMVQRLDRAEPQVMISVLIAEVTLRDQLELGIEMAGQDLMFTESAIVGPNGVIKGDQFDYILGTTLGAAGSGLGVNFTVVGEDFSFLLHALQQDSRAETLSRPILLVRNGEEGNITIADQVPFVQSSQLNDTGSTNSVIGSEDVGIVLTTTPNISPDGYVTLALRQELSTFTGQNLQLTEGVSSPVFSTRELETNVTLRDGETVIIGGLITTREDESENKVPILGDLPIIGALFRSTAITKEKTELIIVLTVDILRTDEDVYRMSVEQRDKFVLPDSIRQSPLMEGLRIMPEESMLGPVHDDGDAGDHGDDAPRTPGERRKSFGPRPKTYGPKITRPKATSTVMKDRVYGPVIPVSAAANDG